MPLSSVLGAQSLVRPGVCTSTTRPASPFEGQVIYETDTNQVLVYSGTAWVMLGDLDTPNSLQLIKTQTIGSAVASVTVGDVFSAEFENYRIIVTGGVGSTAQAINMVLGASTASYYSSLGTIQYAADTFGYVRSNNAASWALGGSYVNGNSLDTTLFGPFEARRTGLLINGYVDFRTNGAPSVGGGGFHDVAASYTGFTISVGGTMTGGTIRVYGYRNA